MRGGSGSERSRHLLPHSHGLAVGLQQIPAGDPQIARTVEHERRRRSVERIDIADEDRPREFDALRNVKRAASRDLHPHQRRQKARIQKAVNDALGKLRARGKFIVDMQSVVIARQPRECRDVFRCNGAAEAFRLTDAEFTKAIWLQRGDPYRGARLRRSDSQKIRVVI